MRTLIFLSLTAGASLAACSSTQSELRKDRLEVREQRGQLEDAKRYGDLDEVRKEREDVRDAREEMREDR